MWSLLFGVASVHSQKFTFGAAGDFSTGANFLSTLDAIKTANVDLMLALGDLAYEEKKVSSFFVYPTIENPQTVRKSGGANNGAIEQHSRTC